MCGIAGWWNRDRAPVDEARLGAMVDVLAHRGRDDQGTWTSGDIGLGHRRLSIIDLSSSGHQPMHDDRHGLHLVFNGEIHNYIELRDELMTHGYVFRTHTDTEVILAAYVQWGEKCFERFNGMWALAIWNDRTEELLLSRDRFGIKPLVYAEVGSQLLFASEPKALLAAHPGLNEPDWHQVYVYLHAAITDIGRDTFFRRIHPVLAGHCLHVTRSGVREFKHWTFVPGCEEPRPDAVEQFRHLLTDAVKLRLRSDAPLGIWLSGGLDSSVIAKIAAAHSDRPVQCFSIKYEQYPRFDESAYISAVAASSENIQVTWVSPDGTGLIDTIGDIVRHHDAPAVSRGRYAGWSLSKESARDVRVVLSGDGADELLGGYQTFAAPYALDRLMMPAPGQTRSLRAVKREYDRLCSVARPGLSRWQVMVRGPLCRMGISPGMLHSISPPGFSGEFGPCNAQHHFSGWASGCGHKPYRSLLNNALWREFHWRGLPEMMKGFDALSMAHTLEMRSPFLDHRVVEFCFSLPYFEKISGGTTKQLLRKAFADQLPDLVKNRVHKLGFPSPLVAWFGQPENFNRARELLLDGHGVRCGVFDRQRLNLALSHLEHHAMLSGTPRHVLLWAWVSMEWWLRLYHIS